MPTDKLPPDEVVVDVLEVDAEDQPPLEVIVLVNPIIKTLVDTRVVSGPETSDSKTTGEVEDNLPPAPAGGLSTKPSRPVKMPPLNPKEEDETSFPAEPDRNTKLPPLATGKTELNLRRVDGSPAPPTRATDAPTAVDIAKLAADDTTAQPAVPPTRASATMVAARVAADSAFSAAAAARSTADVPAATTGAAAATTGAFAEAAARVAAGVTAENAHVPQTSDARRADDARLTADRVIAFSRTSPRASLNDMATADRVERPAPSISMRAPRRTLVRPPIAPTRRSLCRCRRCRLIPRSCRT